MFYPYNFKQQAPILDFCTEHGIVTQGYGVNMCVLICTRITSSFDGVALSLMSSIARLYSPRLPQ